MILVIALLVESFAAVFADVRFVAGVDASVRIQCGRTIESLVANVAFVRLVGRVDDFVAAERGRLTETFAADFAYEWPGTGVDGHVSRQVVVSVEYFAAFLTGKHLPFLAIRIACAGCAAGRRWRMVFWGDRLWWRLRWEHCSSARCRRNR